MHYIQLIYYAIILLFGFLALGLVACQINAVIVKNLFPRSLIGGKKLCFSYVDTHLFCR